VKVSEIDWVEAADYYVCLHVGPRTHLLRRSMSELEEELDPTVFCRVHRSSIVNLDRVCGLKSSEDGEYEVLLENGASLRAEPALPQAVAIASGRSRCDLITTGRQRHLDVKNNEEIEESYLRIPIFCLTPASYNSSHPKEFRMARKIVR